jgi:hypothetical protein
VALVVIMAVMIGSYTDPGLTSAIGTGGVPLLLDDYSTVPPAVADDASALAQELFGEPQMQADFVDQQLALYVDAQDKDFILVFSSGGWGWSLLEESPGWWGIFEGMETELASLGYTSLELDYLRTTPSVTAQLDEFWEMLVGYPSKAEILTARIAFLTDHLPDVRVILAGESTAAMIIDSTMVKLADSPRVYCIQTGPPFWHETLAAERSLIMMGNGFEVDTLCQGNAFDFLFGCYKKWFGILKPVSACGTEPHIVVAPGHDYWWQYPEVRSQITQFLIDNFAPEATVG